MTRRLLHVVLASVVLVVLQGVLSFLVPVSARSAKAAFLGAAASAVLTAAVLVALRARLRGPRAQAALVLWLIWGGLQVNNLSELLLFDIGIAPGVVAGLALYLLSVAAAFAAFLALALAPATAVEDSGAPPFSAWRLLLSAPLYVVAYFAAGILVWPYVRQFYEARPMPDPAAVLAWQLVRGLVFGSIVLLIVRRLRVRRLEAAVAAAAVLSLLGGVAPLLVDNPFMPQAVRLAHMVEVGVSNLLFGFAMGWLLGRRRGPDEVTLLKASVA